MQQRDKSKLGDVIWESEDDERIVGVFIKMLRRERKGCGTESSQFR